MTVLTGNQIGFISVMASSPDAEADGFSILSQRADARAYFDALKEKGLLDIAKLEGPVPADREGFFRLPYWAGLEYIETVARQCGESGDTNTAHKIAQLIVEFSRNASKEQRQNYVTWSKFADAIAKLPLSAIKIEINEEAKLWLSSNFDRSLVAEALGSKLLPRLIASEDQSHKQMALQLFGSLIGVRQAQNGSPGSDEASTEIDSYWVNEILKRNLKPLSLIAPRETADLLRQRLGEVFVGKKREGLLVI